jgi:tetraacyldisaccharide 4'-kinase
MQPPEFWASDAWPARLLEPAGRLYGLAGRLRRRLTTPFRAAVPVVCVGNLTAGGTGKTPIAIELARQLQSAGANPHLLSRGYRGDLVGPVRVDPARHDAAAVGDEPLLLAEVAPTWVSRDRAAGAQAATAAGARAIVMDDGFQNPGLVQDVALLVVDGEVGFGNQRLLPAGPLRERVEPALARADAVVIVGPDRHGLRTGLPTSGPVLAASLVAEGGAALRGRRVVAFAGIGRPAKFFASLREVGAEVLEQQAFADHHRYMPAELDRLRERAGRFGAALVTTAKDRVRLPEPLRDHVLVLRVRARFEEPDALGFVHHMIGAHGGSTHFELRSR